MFVTAFTLTFLFPAAPASAAPVPSGQMAIVTGSLGDGRPAVGIGQVPYGLAVSSSGVYVSDQGGDNVVRLLDPATGNETLVAGNGSSNAPTSPSGVDPRELGLQQPGGMSVDPTNNTLVFDESRIGVVLRYTPVNGSTPAQLSQVTSAQGTGWGDGTDTAVDSQGNIAFPEFGNNDVRVVAGTTGTFWGIPMTAGSVYKVAGNGAAGNAGPNGQVATSAVVEDPWAVAIDHSDNLIISDESNHIDVVAASSGTFYGQSMTVGHMYGIAGTGACCSNGFGGDGGPAVSASIASPHGLSVDAHGNVLVPDTFNHRIRVIAESTGSFYGVSMTAGDIYTVVGNPPSDGFGSYFGGYSGDGGPATAAEINDPTAVVTDASGNLVIADEGNDRVRVVAELSGTFYGMAMTQGDIYTVAGNGTRNFSGDGGSQAAAQLYQPQGLSVDSAGNQVIADAGDNRIRVAAASSGTFYGVAMTAGDIYTVAGGGAGGDTGPATTASLAAPGSAVTDGSGNLLIADTGDHTVRVVAASTGTFYGVAMTAGDIYTVAGDGTQGDTGDGAAAMSAELDSPASVVVDPNGNLVVADTGHTGCLACSVYTDSAIRVVAASTGSFYGIAMTKGDIYTVAGNGTGGFNGDTPTLATSAVLNGPQGLAVDPAGNLVVADTGNGRVRVIATNTGADFGTAMTAGDIYTVMGGGHIFVESEGVSPTSVVMTPARLAFDHQGDLIVSDTHYVWVLAATSTNLWGQSATPGLAYFVAGNASGGAVFRGSGSATADTLWSANGVAVDPSGNLLLVESGVQRIVAIGNAPTVTSTSLPGGHVGTPYASTLAEQGGTAPFTWTLASGSLPPGLTLGTDGTISGTPTAVGIYPFTVMVTDSALPSGSATQPLSITVEPPYATSIINTQAGTGSFTDDITPAGVPIAGAGIGFPDAVVVDTHGNTVFSDVSANVVNVVAKSSGTYYGVAMTAGDAYTIAGSGTSIVPGSANAVSLGFPTGLAVDHAGNVVIAQVGGSLVSVVADTTGLDDGISMTAGNIYTIAGTGSNGSTGDGGPATSATVDPDSVAVDAAGNVIVTQSDANEVRVVAESNGTFYGVPMTAGDIYTVAGNGTAGYSGDSHAATSAELNAPNSVVVDAAGNLAIADYSNNVVRVVANTNGTDDGIAMTAGDIYTVAGNGTGGFTFDGTAATASELNGPVAVAVDPFGNLYIADSSNNRVRMVAESSGTFYGIPMTAGDIYTVAGTGVANFSGDSGPSGLAELNGPFGLTVSPDGTLLIADSGNDRIRFISGGLSTAGVVSSSSSTAVASPTSVPADGSTKSTITVTLLDGFLNPVAGKTVSLTPAGGSSNVTTVNATTNASGQAVFSVTDTVAESVIYTATDTTDSVTVSTAPSVSFTAGSVSAGTSMAVASPTSVPADGSTKSTITVTLLDGFLNPVAGKTVSLTPAGGSSSVTTVNATTNASGQAVFSVTDTVAESVTYTATDTTDSVTVSTAPSVSFTAGSVSASTSMAVASPTSVPADGSTKSTITVTLLDGFLNPVAGKNVSLTPAGGSSSVTTVNATTNASGQAVFSVTDTVAESVTYTATDTTDSVTVTTAPSVSFTAGSVSAGTSMAVASPTSVPADGSTKSTITVTLLDGFLNPVAGKTVSLTPAGGSSSVTTVNATTNASGQAVFSVTDTVAESVTYTATDTTDSVTVSTAPSVSFAAGSVSAGTSMAVASPTSVPADGSTKSTITVTLLDGFLNPVAGKTVSLTPAGGSSSVTTVNATTNASGQAVFSVTDTVAESVTYTATDTTDSVTVSTAPSVSFTAGSVSAGTSMAVASPTSVPADGSTKSTITVTLLDGFLNPVAGKTVSLTPAGGSSNVTTVNATTNASGQAVFSVTDTVAESVTYTATDTTDSVTVATAPSVSFTAGSVSAGTSMAVASPTSVPADGSTKSTITVTLLDGFLNPVAGKNVSLTPAGGSSSVTTVNATTNASGQAVFSVTDTVAESVTYTATDTTDSVTVSTAPSVSFTAGSVSAANRARWPVPPRCPPTARPSRPSPSPSSTAS